MVKGGRYFTGILLIFFLSGSTFPPIQAQEPSYPDIFGDNWTKARQFVADNQSWMRLKCAQFRVDYPLAVSMVFPELIRYSALRDRMEITLLKTLYTYKGSEYSDFSVGVFQIKPSCAEAVLRSLSERDERKLYRHFYQIYHSLPVREFRSSVVRELEDPVSGFLYVIAIIKILDRLYSSTRWESRDEMIRFYAAAYNSGFLGGEKHIRSMMEEHAFHTGMRKPGKCFSYPGISAAFYHLMSNPDFYKED